MYIEFELDHIKYQMKKMINPVNFGHTQRWKNISILNFNCHEVTGCDFFF